MNCVQLAVRQLEAAGQLMPPGRAALISANAASRCGRSGSSGYTENAVIGVVNFQF